MTAPAERIDLSDRFDAAAKWWRDVLVGGAKQDNGDSSEVGLMTRGLMGLIADRQPALTTEQADAFQADLAARLRAKKHLWGFGTDYGPDQEICESFKAATGHEAGCPPFPIKTIMWIEASKVTVKYGYGAPIETVWLAAEDAS